MWIILLFNSLCFICIWVNWPFNPHEKLRPRIEHSVVHCFHMYCWYHQGECCTYNNLSPPPQKTRVWNQGSLKQRWEKMSAEAPGSGQNYLGLLLKWKQMCPQSSAKSVRRGLLGDTHTRPWIVLAFDCSMNLWVLINKLRTHAHPCVRKRHFLHFSNMEMIWKVRESGDFSRNARILRKITRRDIPIVECLLRAAFQTSLIPASCWDQEPFHTAAYAEEGSRTSDLSDLLHRCPAPPNGAKTIRQKRQR